MCMFICVSVCGKNDNPESRVGVKVEVQLQSNLGQYLAIQYLRCMTLTKRSIQLNINISQI